MRPSILIALTALALAACGKDAEEDSNANAGAGLTAENIVTNDITAIDAVTADAANMAADINYADAFADLSSNGADSNASDTNSSRTSARPRHNAAPATRPPVARRETPAETNAQ